MSDYGEMHQMKETLLAMMKYMDTVFRENNIWYTLAYGTLLGAVREKGFIPWDVDLDICIRYTDQAKMREILSKDVGLQYYLCVPGVEKKYIANHDRLVYGDSVNSAYHIDIYSLIGVPDDPKKARRYVRQCCSMVRFFSSKYKNLSNTKRKVLLYPAKLLAMFCSNQYIVKKYMSISEKYPVEKTKYVSVLGAAYREFFEKSLFSSTSYMQFEDARFMCINEYDKYLRQIYGDYGIPRRSHYAVKN